MGDDKILLENLGLSHPSENLGNVKEAFCLRVAVATNDDANNRHHHQQNTHWYNYCHQLHHQSQSDDN